MTSPTYDKGKSVDRSNGQGSSSTMMSRLMAAYDAKHGANNDAYYEVPASHFLARPAGSSATPTSANQNRNINSTSSISHLALSGTVSEVASGSASKSRKISDDGERSDASFVTVLEAPITNTSRSQERQTNISDDIKSTFSYPSLAEDRDLLSGSNPFTDQGTSADGAPSFFGGQRPHMPDTSTLAAADYDVDVRSGFLPPQEPVYRLQGIEEELWETALDRARSLPLRIGGGGIATTKEARKQARQWRRDIRQMLILHPSPQLTSDIRFARRAHLVLAFLVHFYMHSQPEAQSDIPNSLEAQSQDEQDQIDEAKGLYHGIVPASLAIPWVSLSHLIDIPPVLTYATTVMWNWALKDTEKGFTDDNLRMTTTFSGTRSEEHFYMTSVLIEKRGVEALTLMRRSLDEAFVGDTLALRRMRSYIRKLAKVLKDLQQLLHDVRTECDPTTFYWGIRPWFNGADSYIDKETGEKGWIYEGVEEYKGKRMLFMGPSAGQSSLIHVIDVFLGVDHSGRSSAPSENGTFMERMQTYMPGHHRNFLNHLRNISFVDDDDQMMEEMEIDTGSTSAHSDEDMDVEEEEAQPPQKETHPLRSLLIIKKEEEEDDSREGIAHRHAVERLREAYNEALNSLKHMRDEHMRIATLYIVSQMRKSPPAEFAKLSEALTLTKSTNAKQQRLAHKDEGEDANPAQSGGAKGTGGTDLVSFLRDCRKNTVNALFADSKP